MSDKKKAKKDKKDKKKKDKKLKKAAKKQEKKAKKEKKRQDKKEKKEQARSSSSSSSSSSSAAATGTTTSSSIFNITNDDYFRKGPNFRHWLSQSKQIDFEDLETIKARHYFEQFVELWNTNQLPSAITSLSSTAIRAQPRTKFAWGIETSSKEQFKLDSLHDSISNDTNKRKAGTLGPSGPPTGFNKKSRVSQQKSNPKRDLILAKARAAEAAEEAKMVAFKKAMGLS